MVLSLARNIFFPELSCVGKSEANIGQCTLQVCVMWLLGWDSHHYLPPIACMEAADSPLEAAPGCVRDLSKLQFSAVKACAEVS